MTDLKVWLRVGDQDDYHDFDSIDEAGNELAEILNMSGDSFVATRYRGSALIGVEINDTTFVDQNAISFFWGDGGAQFEVEISDFELECLNNILIAI